MHRLLIFSNPQIVVLTIEISLSVHESNSFKWRHLGGLRKTQNSSMFIGFTSAFHTSSCRYSVCSEVGVLQAMGYVWRGVREYTRYSGETEPQCTRDHIYYRSHGEKFFMFRRCLHVQVWFALPFIHPVWSYYSTRQNLKALSHRILYVVC